MAWKLVPESGRKKPRKVPINPASGFAAKVSDTATWGTYDEAASRARRDGLAGVGLVLTADDGLTGIDLDNCRDPVTGELSPLAVEVVHLAETYAEVSPSGSGLRLFADGKPVRTMKNDSRGIEVYGAGRYLTVTGDHFPGTPGAIGPAPATMKLLMNAHACSDTATPANAEVRSIFDTTGAHLVAKGERPEHYSKPPALADLGKACKQFRWAASSKHQPDVTEPQWTLGVLPLARHTKEGRSAAHACSCKHPHYDREEADGKIDRQERHGIGPTMCGTIANLFGAERCAGCFFAGNPTSSPIVAAGKLPPDQRTVIPDAGIVLTDLWALADMHRFMCPLTGKTWPAAGVDGKFGRIAVGTGTDGKSVTIPAHKWLYQHQGADGLTWWPGLPQVIENRIAVDGSLVEKMGTRVLNLYRPPVVLPGGDPAKAGPWVDHVRAVYPEDTDHLIAFFAHRYQRPEEKINHALVLGGSQGIGKDTILIPVQQALGLWNCREIKPLHLTGRFTSFFQSTLLIVSEVHDTGDMGRYQFYETSKTTLASPPEYLQVEEKFVPAYYVPNCCGVVMTTNHKVNGIYLPPDDRRHYVAWSPRKPGDFSAERFDTLYAWFASGGNAHVQAYLAAYNLSGFNAKAPPPKTQAWHEIVSAGRSPEDAELADLIDKMGCPDALTIRQLVKATAGALEGIGPWLREPKNRRPLQGRLERAGYVAVSNGDAKNGMWRVGGERVVIYVKDELPERDRQHAARSLASANPSR